MGKMVNDYRKGFYYECDDGIRVFIGKGYGKYATQEIIETLLDDKPAYFERKSLFGKSKVEAKLKYVVSKMGNPYYIFTEGNTVETFDDRDTVKVAISKIIPNTYLEKEAYKKHIQSTLESLNLIKEYNIFIDEIEYKGEKFTHFIVYRDYNGTSGLNEPKYQVLNKYVKYDSTNALVDECTELEYIKTKQAIKEELENLKKEALEKEKERKRELFKAHHKDFISPIMLDYNIYMEKVIETLNTIGIEGYELSKYYNRDIKVSNNFYLETGLIWEFYTYIKDREPYQYVGITIKDLGEIYLKYDNEDIFIEEITKEEYDETYKTYMANYRDYKDNLNAIKQMRKDLYDACMKDGLSTVVNDVDINNALDMGYFDIFKRGLGKKQGDDAIYYICMNIYPDNENLSLLKQDILNVLKIFYEFNNISAKNIASLAPFIAKNNIKAYYDDMLLYDEAIEPIIHNTTDKKLLRRVLGKIAGTSRAATYVDRTSTFYFEKTVRAKNTILNPVQLLDQLVGLIPEYNMRSDVVVLFNIILNADESFTYQFYTFAEDESGGDMDGRRVGNMTRIYNRTYSPKIEFEYDF